MTPMQIIFWIAAATILGSALMVVSRRNLVHSALFLVLALFGVAVFFVLLEASFLAVIQVLVYIGAIAILMIFAVMLTRQVTQDDGAPFNKKYGIAVLIAALVFEGLIVILNKWPQYNAVPSQAVTGDTVRQLGLALVDSSQFVIPFEVASVLLVGAMIGAIVIASERKE